MDKFIDTILIIIGSGIFLYVMNWILEDLGSDK